MVIIKILVPIGDRADQALSVPIIRRLNKSEKIECIKMYLTPADYEQSYMAANYIFQVKRPDLVFCTADRPEMAAAAAAAFHNNIKIAHFYAGILSPLFETFDTIDRHVISLYSDIQFVEDYTAWHNLDQLFNSIKKKSNCYIVGISHFDDIEIDESKVPSEPYDLILINAITRHKKTKFDFYEDLSKIKLLDNKIQIGSNADGQISRLNGCKYYNALPREEFLGLLKNCHRFITNSSAGHYEAPLLGLQSEQIIFVGARNRERSMGSVFIKGASDKIVEVLEKLE